MARRPIFRAVIRLDDQSVPVKLYTAVRSERVSFRLLHEKDKEPLQQRMYCSSENRPVGQEERARGFEVARGQYVVVDLDELREIQPETNRAIEVLHFVKPGEIDPRLYQRPYYLGPDASDDAYALVVRALRETDRAAVCRWAMRGKSYIGVLRPRDDLLLLVTLRYAHQLVPVESLDLKHPRCKKKELDMAVKLIEEMSSDFDASGYRNDHQQRLLSFIEQKAKGKKPKTKPARRRTPTSPSELQARLEESLAERKAG